MVPHHPLWMWAWMPRRYVAAEMDLDMLRQSYVACRGFQLSGRGPLLFKAALAAEEAKI